MNSFAPPVAYRDQNVAGSAVVRLHPRNRTARHDPRWPEIAAALATLRDGKRRAVRIVDADCGAGCLLLEAVRYAHALGFTAIEGRGIDASPALIGRARAAAARLCDRAIGVTFETADVMQALDEEQYFPADIVLWQGAANGGTRDRLQDALDRAGHRVIGERADMRRGMAA